MQLSPDSEQKLFLRLHLTIVEPGNKQVEILFKSDTEIINEDGNMVGE